MAVIDGTANAGDAMWRTFHEKNRDCNLRLEVLNPQLDAEHPVIKNALQKGIKFPCTVLVAPDEKIFQFEEKDISKIYDQILETALGEKLRTTFPDVFAVVVWIEGEDATKNLVMGNKVTQECAAIENIMPGMPKIVKKGPLSIGVTKDDFQNERLLLWSLGIETVPENPVAFVLYGRGRKIGDALDFKQVQEGGLYKYMSMIGADCECGLDKKWMLGNQVPLLWNADSRQHLAKLVGFDVDNPMILAEMSRILAKESLSDKTGSVAFAPEIIDLDEVFGNSAAVKQSSIIEPTESKSENILIYTLIALFVVVLLVGAVIFMKKK